MNDHENSFQIKKLITYLKKSKTILQQIKKLIIHDASIKQVEGETKNMSRFIGQSIKNVFKKVILICHQ